MPLPNEARGLHLADADFEYLSEGAFAVVFVNKKLKLARKVFFRRPDEKYVRDTFEAEAAAYPLAYRNAEVEQLVPTGFRRLPAQTILDRNDKDVSEEFFADLAMQMQYIECDFHKIANARAEERNRIHTLFHEAGIRHTIDASVCMDADGKIVKVVDFATRELIARN